MSSVKEPLVSKGYELLRSLELFERNDALEKRLICFVFVAKKDAIHHMRMWCGIQNAQLEEIFHRTSGIDKKYRRLYTVVNLGKDGYLDLDRPNGIEIAKAEIRKFVDGTALPFLERAYSMADYSGMLNGMHKASTVADWFRISIGKPTLRCPYHGNTENRFHYGLICAKLAGDLLYESLKETYAKYLRKTNKGFYYPRFERLIEDLERDRN